MNYYNKIRIRNTAIAVFPALHSGLDYVKMAILFRKWRKDGFISPLPGLVKRMILLGEIRRLNATWFVETGTYLGDTLWFMRREVRSIVSVELDPSLAQLARKRFATNKHVTIMNGDSSDLLETVVSRISGNAVFWLDGHYSAGPTSKSQNECPVLVELEAIAGAARTQAVSISIDDARLFDVHPGYPTKKAVFDKAKALFPGYDCVVENDMIMIRQCER